MTYISPLLFPDIPYRKKIILTLEDLIFNNMKTLEDLWKKVANATTTPASRFFFEYNNAPAQPEAAGSPPQPSVAGS